MIFRFSLDNLDKSIIWIKEHKKKSSENNYKLLYTTNAYIRVNLILSNNCLYNVNL